MDKKIFILLAGSILSGLLSAATITTGVFDAQEYDSFFGATISSSTPTNNEIRPVDFLFNGVVSGGDNESSVIFANVGAGGTVFVEFETAAAVNIDTIKLALRIDSNVDGRRAVSAWNLYANNTGTSFSSEDSISAGSITPEYISAYGNHAIVVTDEDLSTTAQYFRLELTQAGADGVRAVELAAIPEVGQFGLIAGVVLFGLTLFARRR